MTDRAGRRLNPSPGKQSGQAVTGESLDEPRVHRNIEESARAVGSDRRACVQTLAEPFKRPTSMEALASFKSLQETIIAIDLAIADENIIEKARRSDELIEEIRRRSDAARF